MEGETDVDVDVDAKAKDYSNELNLLRVQQGQEMQLLSTLLAAGPLPLAVAVPGQGQGPGLEHQNNPVISLQKQIYLAQLPLLQHTYYNRVRELMLDNLTLQHKLGRLREEAGRAVGEQLVRIGELELLVAKCANAARHPDALNRKKVAVYEAQLRAGYAQLVSRTNQHKHSFSSY